MVVVKLWVFAKYFFVNLMLPLQPFAAGQDAYMCTQDSEINITYDYQRSCIPTPFLEIMSAANSFTLLQYVQWHSGKEIANRLGDYVAKSQKHQQSNIRVS